MRGIGIVVSALVLAGCAGGDASDTATDVTMAPPSTTTTIGTTTTTEDPEITAVRNAHLAFLELFELVGDPPNPDHPELARRATGDAYERLHSNLLQAQATGRRLVGRWDSAIQSIAVEGQEARVEDCLLDQLQELSASGDVITPADTDRFVRTVRLRFEPDGWKAWRLDIPNPVIPCDA